MQHTSIFSVFQCFIIYVYVGVENFCGDVIRFGCICVDCEAIGAILVFDCACSELPTHSKNLIQ